MKYAQLRRYTINKGQMDSWLECFKEEIPILDHIGIKVESYWINEEKTQFIWIRSFGPSKESIEELESKFYDTNWWKTNIDRIRSHIAHREFEVIFS